MMEDVLICFPTARVGGAEQILRMIALAELGRGNRVTALILSRGPGPISDSLALAGASIHLIQFPREKVGMLLASIKILLGRIPRQYA